jgi:hypothetical protein
MSNLKEFEVKIQLKGGNAITTVIFAENDFRARQLIKLQYAGVMANISSLREIR